MLNGANEFIVKPFSVREVVEQIRSLLLNSESRGYSRPVMDHQF